MTGGSRRVFHGTDPMRSPGIGKPQGTRLMTGAVPAAFVAEAGDQDPWEQKLLVAADRE
jgi:hypothetical protein